MSDEHGTPDYLSVDIQLLREATRDIPFDLFLKIAEDHYTHVFSRSTGLDYKRLAEYIKKGVKELYLRKEEQDSFHKFIAQSAPKIIKDPAAPKEKKIAALLNMTEQNMAELFSRFDVPEETAQKTQKVVKSYVSLMADNPKTLVILMRLASQGDYLYFHSIAVSIFSMYIAKALGQFDRRGIEIIGLGGFLHDLGSTQLPSEMVNSAQNLDSSQWDQMRTHTKLGLRMIENTPNIPDEVRFIVYQHHEKPDGTGYPNGLKGDAIFYPARIVGVADSFSALISHRPFRPAYSVDQALHILQSEIGSNEPELVKVVASLFQGGLRKKAA